jgi:nitrate reductase NapE component
MKTSLISFGAFLAFQTTALACPACAVTSPQNDQWQTFWLLSTMGILPIILVAIVGAYIVRIGKRDENKVTPI